MSAPVITMRMLEPALRQLAADPDMKVAVAAAKHLPAGVKLGDCCAAIWNWFKEHNAGRRQVSSTRIDSALTREPPPQVCPPAAKASIQKAVERKAREPIVPAHSAPNSAVVIEDPFDKDDGSSPWAKRPRRPRVNAVAHWRSRLVAISIGDKSGLEGPSGGAWWSCRRKWFGTATPAPKMVERFLAWFDAGEAPVRISGETKPQFSEADISAAFKRAAAAGRAAAGKEPRPTVATPSPASTGGWVEIAPACGGHADYDARFSGNETKCKRLGFTRRASMRLAERGFAVGKFVRIHWNADSRQLALTIAETGFKIRAGKNALGIAGAGLISMLGTAAIEFVQATDVKGFGVVLSAKGGAE